jgi:hypothetical protein
MIGNLIFIRTNGMVGNPLEFSFFLLLMQLLSLTKFYQGKKIYIVYYLIFFVATITTLSRFAFAASVFMYPLVAFLLGRYKLVLVLSGIIFIAGLGLVVALGDKLDLYLMVSDRLLNKSDVQSNNVSTENRFKYFDATIDMMSEFPYFFTGYQIGKISSFGATGGKKVHDGFWLAAIIEQGVPFFIYYVFWWVYLLFACLKRIMRENAFTISGFVVVLLCITGGIVNSAYFNIVNCVTVFLIIGFNLRIYYLSTREDSDSYE